MSKVDWCFKVIVVGDSGVGKTSLIRRFVHNSFVEEYKETIGAEFVEKDVIINTLNTLAHLMLWDTAGNQEFNVLTQAYYRGSAAAILAFSAADRISFCNIVSWKSKVEAVCGQISMILCETKMDLVSDNGVKSTEAEQLAEQLRIPYFRVSTKDNFNVKHLFQFVAQMCVLAETEFTALNTNNLLSINSNAANITQNMSNKEDILNRLGNIVEREENKNGVNNIRAIIGTSTENKSALADVNTHSAFSLTDSAFPTNLPQESRGDSKEVVHIVPTTNSLANAVTSSIADHQRNQHHHKSPDKMKIKEMQKENIDDHKNNVNNCAVDNGKKTALLTNKPFVEKYKQTELLREENNADEHEQNAYTNNNYRVNAERGEKGDKVNDKVQQKKLLTKPSSSPSIQHKNKKKKKKKVKCALM